MAPRRRAAGPTNTSFKRRNPKTCVTSSPVDPDSSASTSCVSCSSVAIRSMSLDRLPFDYPDCKDRVEAIVGDIRDRAAVDRAMRDVRDRRALRRGAAAVLEGRHHVDRHRRHAQRPGRGAPGEGRARHPRVVHRGLRRPRPSSALRDRPAHRRGTVRRGEDRRRAAVRRLPGEGHVHSRSCGRSRSWGPSGSACSRSCSIGRATAVTFRCPGPGTTSIS